MRVFESRKLLPVSVLLLLLTLAVNGATRETAVVKDLSFNPAGNSLEVRIATSTKPQYTYFELSGPRRLVVDFHGIQNGVGFKEKAVGQGGVERVRTSLFVAKNRRATRIVFDLEDRVPYTVSDAGGNEVRVVFGKSEETAKPLSPVAEPPAIPAAEPVEPAALPPVSISIGAPSVPEPAPEVPMAAPVMAAPAAPPASIVIEPEPVKSIPAQPAPIQSTGASRGGVLIAGSPSFSPSPTPAGLSAGQIPAALSGSQTTPQYTGEIESFDFKDVDIKDFFRLIANFSGLNIILDPGVSGTVTMTLIDVPWDQALDIVLKNHQLGAQLQGNVLRIATNSALQAEETARKNLQDLKDSSAPLETHSRILNYTKSDAVAATLQKVITTRGTIIQDARRNALIISDIPSQFSKIEQLLDFLDIPAQQVEIEARLLSANKSFSRELGNQLGFILGNPTQGGVGGVSSVGTSPITRAAGSLPLNVNLPAAGTSGLSFFLGTGADQILDEIITAAEASGTARLISRPRVMAQNNIPAIISQGTQIPVQTSQNNTVSVQFINFSLKLTVTPQITDAGTILLRAQVENSTPDFAKAVNGIPSVATQQASTEVLIADGGTAVIGGILVDTDTFNVREVPGLGSIPLIGHLFKNSSAIKSTSELLFFVTGRIQPRDAINVMPPQEKPPGQQR